MGSSTSILGSIKHTLHAALESVSPTIRIHWRSLELMQQYCYRRPKQNCKIYKIISRVWYTVSQQDAIDTTKKKNSYSRIVLVVRILLHQNNNTKSADYSNEVIFCGLLTTTIKNKRSWRAWDICSYKKNLSTAMHKGFLNNHVFHATWA